MILANFQMSKKLPLQIVCGAKRPSFAFSTASERWPKIVAGIVDKLHQSHYKTVKEQGEVSHRIKNGN